MADLGEVGGSNSETDVFKALVGVDAGVEVPVSVVESGDAVVVVDLEVVAGFDLGVDGFAFGQSKEELGLVCDCELALVVSGYDCLDVDSASVALGVDLGSVELFVREVVSEDGVGLLGEVTPGLYSDRFGL